MKMKLIKIGLIICGVLLVGMAKAQCTKNVFLKYSKNDIDTLIVNCGETIPADSLLQKKDCHTIANWYSDSTLTTVWKSTFTITSDTTLFPEFGDIIKYKVFLKYSKNDMDTLIVNCGETIPADSLPQKKDCYIIANWYSDSTLTTVLDPKSTIASDIILYAKLNTMPASTEIVPKGGSSNILICKEVSDGSYQWGYFLKGKTVADSISLIDKNGYDKNYSYYKFDIGIDTTKYVYFVEILGKDCPTYAFYPSNSTPTTIQDESPHTVSTYPNPAKGTFSVTLSPEVKGKIVVSLQNLSGQILLSKQISDYENSEVLPFNSNYPPGIYLLVVQTGEGVITSKIIIE